MRPCSFVLPMENVMKKISRLTCLTLFVTVIFAFSAFSKVPNKDLLTVKSKHLSNLILSIEYIASEIESAQKLLASPDSLGREAIIKQRIDELSRKMAGLDENFDLLATGVNYKTAPETSQDSFDWNRELKKLIGPLIEELQELTLRPREIEKLKGDVSFYKEHIKLADTAIDNLNRLITVSKKPGHLRKRLQKSVEEWSNRKNEWESLMNIGAVQLELKQGDQSISKSIQDIPKIFFKSHGRNGLIAFLVLCLSLAVFFKLYGIIKKYNPRHSQQRSFYGRIFDLGYIFCAILISMLTTLAVLYLFNDWVLLSVAIIFLLGLFWASKHALPKMWFQVKLILNLGPVREGEVVVYNGLIYRVVSINLHTTLENPQLQGGLIRIPISDIMELRSRPAVDDEPWFPSMLEDWVLLGGDRHGQIITQTPETVKMKLLGGAEVAYATGDYLGQSPMNLSSGFRLSLAFGLDYQYQAEITGSIPAILEEGVVEELTVAGFSEKTVSVNVYFKTAAPSSLDLEVIANFNETAGRDYSMLERVIQRACVNVCNKQNWSIPFMQMTVHMAGREQ